MQLFILLYIEAGSYINDEEDQWEFVVLYVAFLFQRAHCAHGLPSRYEKRRRRHGDFTYHFVGYSSLYNFYHFPEKVRLRLRYVAVHDSLRSFTKSPSQFVILTPYQRQSHGCKDCVAERGLGLLNTLQLHYIPLSINTSSLKTILRN